MKTEQMQPYQYPNALHVRKHAPAGYTTYESYRDWLRDEFHFRCVYCLYREKWSPPRGVWHIDHWQSQEDYPEKIVDFGNLIYSCAGCNLAKGKKKLPNPCTWLISSAVKVYEDGTIEATSIEAKRIIRKLGLDSPEDIEYRSQLIGIYHLKEYDYPKFLAWMEYPKNLPDLSRKRPPNNSRTESINQSFFARRQRGELPEYY